MFDTASITSHMSVRDNVAAKVPVWSSADANSNTRSQPTVGLKTERMVNSVDLDQISKSMSDLLVDVGRQDRTAFRAIFDHFAPRLKAFLMGQGTNPQMAEEVVQETMVKIWRKADQFDPSRAAASTWIFTIARNMRIDHLRKFNRPEPDMNDPAFVPDPEPLATETISQSEDAAQLHAAMAELSEDQRAVLKLAYFEDRAHPEIAETLDIPLGTVKSRIRLALKNIRSTIGDSQ